MKKYPKIVEQFREVIPLISKIHEESWESDGKGWGKYKKDEYESAAEACKKIGVPEELAYIFYLLFPEMNDLLLWAENPSEFDENDLDDGMITKVEQSSIPKEINFKIGPPKWINL